MLFSRHFLLPLVIVIVLCLLVNACTSKSPAESLADIAKGQETIFYTDEYLILGVHANGGKSDSLRVYIEGDGQAFRYGRVSSDPTPKNLQIVRLAIADKKPSLYLARPCQFVPSVNCYSDDWHHGRYSQKIINAYHQVLNRLKTNYNEFELIGFSGGATVALLLASQRSDIRAVRSIAGNLDHHFFTTHHRVPPLTNSLNPIDCDCIDQIPQQIIWLENDRVIPEQMLQHYLSAFQDQSCILKSKVTDATHTKGWQNQVQALLRLPLATKTGNGQKGRHCWSPSQNP